MRMIPILALAALTVIGGCGTTSSDDNNDTDDNNTACTVTLTGALTATTPCTVTALWQRNVIGVSDLSILNTGSDPKISLGISIDGQFAAGTITESSPEARLAVTVAGPRASDSPFWAQSTDVVEVGSVSVNLTSVSLGSDGYTFTIHGTADATLPPGTPDAAGTVTMHVVF